MPTHFLDLRGRIADLEEILNEYESQLSEAKQKNNQTEINRLSKLIQETKNKIAGIKNSPNYR